MSKGATTHLARTRDSVSVSANVIRGRITHHCPRLIDYVLRSLSLS